MKKPVRKNASKQIAKYLAAATSITFIDHISDGISGNLDSYETAATAHDVQTWIAANYHKNLRLDVHFNKKGECLYLSVRGQYHFDSEFIVRLDNPEKMKQVRERAELMGLEMRGCSEISLWSNNRCIVAHEDLDEVLSQLDKLEEEIAEDKRMTVCAEFLIKSLERDVQAVFDEATPTTSINKEFLQLVAQYTRTGLKQRDVVRMIQITANNIGKRVGLPKLFANV